MFSVGQLRAPAPPGEAEGKYLPTCESQYAKIRDHKPSASIQNEYGNWSNKQFEAGVE